MALFDDEVITDTEVTKRKKLDTFLAHMINEDVTITTLLEFLNEGEEVLRTKQGKNYIYRNYIDDEGNPVNHFDLFLQKLGITKAILKQAIIEMEAL